MSARERLPNRRSSETFEFDHGGHRSIARFPAGGIAELFLSSALVGSPVEALARDAAVTASLAFQYGCAAYRGETLCMSGKAGAREIGIREIGAREIGAREIGAREIGARKIGALVETNKEVAEEISLLQQMLLA